MLLLDMKLGSDVELMLQNLRQHRKQPVEYDLLIPVHCDCVIISG